MKRLLRPRLVMPFCAAVLVLAGALAFAQGPGGFGGGMGGGRFRGEPIQPNTKYDGQFMFVRIRYGPPTAIASQRIPWSHDYPSGERHFMKILAEISYLGPHTEETNIIGLDDPELFKYPLSYLCEPGRWEMTDKEADNLRLYFRKGGFMIFDDFRRYDWENFDAQIHRALPEARWVDLEASNPIFHSFFEIDNLDIVPNFYDSGKPSFRGIYEDNDPKKRLLLVANYNTDISEFWEWSDTGLKPIDDSNEAYKLGVNYIIYGMTH